MLAPVLSPFGVSATAAASLSWFPTGLFWPYFSGAVAALLGFVFRFRSHAPGAGEREHVLRFGPLFFAVPLAVFGAQHFVYSQDIARLVPAWIPGHLFWTYFVGCALIAASLSILVERYSAMAAALLGLMFLLFVALMDAPAWARAPGNRFSLALMLRELSFSGGAFALAVAESRDSWPAIASRARVACRLMIAIPALFYGVEHFLHPFYVPVIPLNQLLPDWFPGRLALGYVAGAVLLASGLCILLNWRARQAAAWLGTSVLVIVLLVYSAFLVGESFSLRGLNFFADTLMYCGVILNLASALPGETTLHV